MRNNYFQLSVFIFLLLQFSSCDFFSQKQEEQTTTPVPQIEVPPFNADSAYQFIQQQVDFGPRVPNTAPHVACGNWLAEKLTDYADKIYLQEGKVIAWNDEKLNFKNIIASFNPENPKRILLCAHWDTRPYADQDEDKSRQHEPIPGANDGGSGVGVLLEIARVLKENRTSLGVDIILFDAEDYGEPEFSSTSRKADTYCLGSQYWSKKPHTPNYKAKYGILLDMVGARNSTFLMEGYSMQYAPSVVRKVWNVAASLGYSQYFRFTQTRPIIDDHYYLNTLAKIPTIDIIHLDNNTQRMFGDFWHTHNDDMSIIDRATLKAVGQTVLKVVYLEEKE